MIEPVKTPTLILVWAVALVSTVAVFTGAFPDFDGVLALVSVVAIALLAGNYFCR